MLSKVLRLYVTPRRQLVGSAAISIGIALLIGYTHNFLSNQGYDKIILAIAMLLTFVGGFTSGLLRVANMTNARVVTGDTLAIGMASMTVGGMAIFQFILASHTLGGVQFYYLTLAGQLILTFSLVYTGVKCFQIRGPWPMSIATLFTGLLAALGVFGLMSQSWMPLEGLANYFGFIRNAFIACLPVVLLLLTVVVPSLRLHPGSMWNSLKMRVSSSNANHDEMMAFWLLGTGSALLTVVTVAQVWLRPAPFAHHETLISSVLDLSWAALIWINYQQLENYEGKQREHSFLATFTGSSARRFLRRHFRENNAWAETVGLRTACFLVDHDPDDAIAAQLPATIYHIRNEEIYRCISDILGPDSLHRQMVGSRVIGSLDPESSLRPCVDTLLMFACLYLDAMPLIERRLKGLSALLPVLDPALANHMTSQSFSRLLTRNLWLFHFDFDWIDQHIINTPQQTRYEVHMNDVPSTTRIAVFEHLQKRSKLGNFIWIGEKARLRLIQEAPVLANIIESLPVPIGANDELLVFLIKFEELIPRLQKFFTLDKLRMLLRDFDPSPEAIQFLNVADVHLMHCHSPNDIWQVVSALVNYPWRGYAEKDQALQIMIKAFHASRKYIDEKLTVDQTPSVALQQLNSRFVTAIANIGYPSQLVHLAQIKKFSLREPARIIDIARKPWHTRFHEAWLLMATTGADRYLPDDLKIFLDFLVEVPTLKQLREDEFVMGKSLAAWINIGCEWDRSETAVLAHILNHFSQWFAAAKASPQMCAYLIDGKLHLEEHLNCALEFDAQSLAALTQYFGELSREYGLDAPEITALSTRWQMLVAQTNSKAA